MKVLILGHSYVRDLERLGNREITVNNILVHLSYLSFPGFRFVDFLQSPKLLDKAISLFPDIILVILGGNDIRTDVDLSVVKDNCRDFFALLCSKFSGSFIIASQIEFRHLKKVNRHSSPAEDLFRKLANSFNNWLNKQKFKDKILIVNGVGKLSDASLFKADGVHLNIHGLEILFELIVSALSGPVDTLNIKDGK